MRASIPYFLAREPKSVWQYRCLRGLHRSLLMRPGDSLTHHRCCCDDASKRSFCRKLRGLSLEQTTGCEHRSALRRRKSMVPRFGDGVRVSGNIFFRSDRRYPLTQIETNSARAFGTNAKAGHVWDNFSSLTYKELSPVDELEFFQSV